MLKSLDRAVLRRWGAVAWQAFERAARDPVAVQERLLMRIVRRNRKTEFGAAHGFDEITGAASFARRVPIRVFDDLAPAVERMKLGEKGILTTMRPVTFNVTSGTSNEPKFVPVTRRGARRLADAVGLWAYRALEDHPSMLDHGTLCITGAPVEGATGGGVPFGSASGLIQCRMPRAVRNASVLPFEPTGIKAYDLRYLLMTRAALERRVSFIATPNPSTLLKLAKVAAVRQEEIVRSIRDGTLCDGGDRAIADEDPALLDRIRSTLRPNRGRARELEEVIARRGRLELAPCWPDLTLIGCWLGGAVGVQAAKLDEHLGGRTPLRDLGHLASEGTFTIPVADGTPSGPLALFNNYIEFLPENEVAGGRTLSSLEVEAGGRYRIIVTNWNGLYRYDIGDLVEVRGIFHRTPIFAFVGKNGEMINLTGEKLHANHLMAAFRRLEEEHGITAAPFAVAPNLEEVRHEILVCLAPAPADAELQNAILPFLDRALGEANIEYREKRRSGRLQPPRLHVMSEAWDEALRREAMETGRRDIQFKRRTVQPEITPLDAAHILRSVEPKAGA